jgi:16S rRNA pseudouridine516 synthase
MEILLTISEGKFHQVKKMLEAVENKVIYLKRLRFGNLELGDLPIGRVREISLKDIF